MIQADRALIQYMWAPGTRQVGKVDVTELAADTQPLVRDFSQKPRFIPEAERQEEPVFHRGAWHSTWMKGDPAETPAGAFGDLLLGEGFASWEYTRAALLAFMNIEGCDWARQMLGYYHPDIHDRE